MRRVAITGLGMVAPTGNSVEVAWKNALEARSAVSRISLFDPKDSSVQIAAEVRDFEAAKFMEAKEVGRASRFVKFAVGAAAEAMADSGLDVKSADTSLWGCAVGVGLGGLEDIEDSSYTLRDKGPRRVSPFFLPYAIPNMASGVVSKYHNLKGPNICTTTACASGTHAIGEAFLYIAMGLADVMVAGGAESAISPLGVASFATMKALSSRNDDPATASRPFDKDRDGFVMGEGAGLLVLEEMDTAVKRGAKIYAELVGYGMSGDAFHITAPAPEHEGGQRCMKLALKNAGISPESLSYINAHGTSTPMNDHYESVAIAKVFGAHAQKIPVSSTKGVTGHCLGAAGGIEAVYLALSVHRNIIPPTANYKTPDPECSLDYVPGSAREKKIHYAMSNSFGFGGTNASIIMKSV